MLSRLNPVAGSRSLLKCKGQLQLVAASTSSVVNQNQSSQRDLVNFPKPTRLEKNPETRLGFIPKSWFDFFYPKTGVTGPYMLLTGLTTYCFSKELIIIDPEFYMFTAGVCLLIGIQKVFGPKIRSFVEAIQEEEKKNLDSLQHEKKKFIREKIKSAEHSLWQAEGVMQQLPEAKRENVYLQMEAAYRSRMQEAFVKVKKHLDYQVEKQNVERRIAQRNMVDYIIKNVEASISPQLKSNALKQCINDLKSLTARS